MVYRRQAAYRPPAVAVRPRYRRMQRLQVAAGSGRPEPLACRRKAAHRPPAGAVRPRHRRIRPLRRKQKRQNRPKEDEEASDETIEKEMKKHLKTIDVRFGGERARTPKES